jgi:hypothetical protein
MIPISLMRLRKASTWDVLLDISKMMLFSLMSIILALNWFVNSGIGMGHVVILSQWANESHINWSCSGSGIYSAINHITKLFHSVPFQPDYVVCL